MGGFAARGHSLDERLEGPIESRFTNKEKGMYWSDGTNRNPWRSNNARGEELDLQDLGWVILALTGWDYDSNNHGYQMEFVGKFLRHCEAGKNQLCEPEIIDSMLESVWAGLDNVHPDCKEYFFRYGRAEYNPDAGQPGEGRCRVCGETLMCNGKARQHKFKELSQEECRKRSINHFGMCWHVYECVRCGRTTAHDSSD